MQPVLSSANAQGQNQGIESSCNNSSTKDTFSFSNARAISSCDGGRHTWARWGEIEIRGRSAVLVVSVIPKPPLSGGRA